ncbi:MAG: hypothetical protein H7A24_08910 [Leptospiraceae bacterium]|nr:hypothetical protein [Leptospiraceae bacterium]MCP5511988.1 hypothetical protein [Leptospiraceae bacterium]
MRKSENELKEIVSKAVDDNKIITMKTYLLSDYGELILKVICSTILERFNRIDHMEICYSAAKELVINATKANVKRALFRQENLNIEDPNDYELGISRFKENLTEDRIVQFRESFVKFDLPVMATFYYSPDVLNIKVKNNFPLLPAEEIRIRDKFNKSTSFSSLIDFFMEYGDNTEGAGMGLTMVGILLDQSGINKHSFSLYSSKKYNETAAKIEIPLSDSYIPKRVMFDREMKEKNISAEELRKSFTYNYKVFSKSIPSEPAEQTMEDE